MTLVLFLLLGWAILSQAMTLRCAGMGTELSNGRDLGEQLEMVSLVFEWGFVVWTLIDRIYIRLGELGQSSVERVKLGG